MRTKTLFDSGAECPDCGMTLSRPTDMKRHRRTRHPTGAEVKFYCPEFGCPYKADQRSNLNSHWNAIHAETPQYACPECGRRLRDNAMLVRHRKKVHKYQPYHTEAYLAKRASKNRKESKDDDKGVPHETRDWRAARAAPSSGATPVDVPTKVAYHDDFWKTLVDVARLSAAKPHDSQNVQVHLPVTAIPGYDTPSILQPVHTTSAHAVTQPQLYTPSDVIHDDSSLLLGPQQDMPVQGQALALPSTQGGCTVSALSYDYTHLTNPTTDLTAFPTSVGPLTYPEIGLQNGSSMPLYSNFSFSSSTTCGNGAQTMHAAPSTLPSLELPFFHPNYDQDASFMPVSGLDWTNDSPAGSTPQSHLDILSPELDHYFNSWRQSNSMF
ncbi:hypothetical protein BJV78DRAFT_556552 [Lactifluus subvellereus]|nr:hypothetical protein BJV78DRAFT_556552 [Lactifluus subvellereus]